MSEIEVFPRQFYLEDTTVTSICEILNFTNLNILKDRRRNLISPNYNCRPNVVRFPLFCHIPTRDDKDARLENGRMCLIVAFGFSSHVPIYRRHFRLMLVRVENLWTTEKVYYVVGP